MERHEFVAIFEPLVIALRADFDRPTWAVYYRALQDVPPRLLQSAVDRLMREDRAFMPKPGEVLAVAERRRKELLEAHPYERCEKCGRTGNRRVPGPPPPKYVRCECWSQWQERVADLGIGTQPLALPAARSGDFERAGDHE